LRAAGLAAVLAADACVAEAVRLCRMSSPELSRKNDTASVLANQANVLDEAVRLFTLPNQVAVRSR
jgi:hypothetical protein